MWHFHWNTASSKSCFFFLFINLLSIERWYWRYESTCIGRASFETYTLCHRYHVHQGPSDKIYMNVKNVQESPTSGKTYVRKKHARSNSDFQWRKNYKVLVNLPHTLPDWLEGCSFDRGHPNTYIVWQIFKFWNKYIYGILSIIMIYVKLQECQGNIANLEAETKRVFWK